MTLHHDKVDAIRQTQSLSIENKKDPDIVAITPPLQECRLQTRLILFCEMVLVPTQVLLQPICFVETGVRSKLKHRRGVDKVVESRMHVNTLEDTTRKDHGELAREHQATDLVYLERHVTNGDRNVSGGEELSDGAS